MAAASGLLLALVTLVNPPALHAQAVSIASVTGRVVDGQGALVTGAQLRMTGVDTGAVYNTVTNADGIYNFPSLPIGAYTLESTVPGFQTSAQRGIVLRVNDHVEIDVTMKVGAVAERVEVTANAGLVQTQQNTISQVVDQQRIVDLPLDEERLEIFKIHLTRRGVDLAGIDLSQLTEFTKGWSGAEVEQCVVSAITKSRLTDTPITGTDLIQAAVKIVPLSRTMEEQINHIRGWAFERAVRASRRR